jgi:hypothetical protein
VKVKDADLEAQTRRHVVANVLAPRVVPARLKLQAELLAGMELRVLRVARGVRGRVPDRRAVREAEERARLVLQVHELELVRGVVVHERGREAGGVVDRRAVVDDVQPARAVEREARGVPDPVREQRAVCEEVERARGGGGQAEGADLGAA